MAVVAGIDEAGYGPKLGPLVVSATAFRVPDQLRETDLWEVLKQAVTRKSGRGVRKLVVTDSKKAYSRSKGVGVLEETVLAFLSISGQRRKQLGELLEALSGEAHAASGEYPWYRAQDREVPLTGRALGAGNKARKLQEVMKRTGVEFLGARSLPVFEGTLNREFERVGNKSEVLFEVAGRLLVRLVEKYGDEGLTVVVDKHGGRDHYGPLLAKPFPGSRFVIHKQGRVASQYEVRGKGKPFQVSFVMEGEDASLAVALASMHSKYVREMYMMMFGEYWSKVAPEVKPTAGYAQDAGRFLREAASAIDRLKIPDRMLVRQR